MEPYNNRRDPNPESRGISPHALIPGIVLVGIGALFLLDNLHIVSAAVLWWPVILIAVGVVHLIDYEVPARRTVGIVLVAAGGIILTVNLGYLSFDIGDLWPLILIAIGLFMLFNRLGWGGAWNWGGGRRWWGHGDDWDFGSGGFHSRGGDSGNDVHEFAIFSGSKRVVTSPNFRVGNASAVFGGINLDLTGAQINGPEAELRLSAVYGGIVVKIPTNWNAEVRGGGLFGGFVDRTVHPPANAPDTKRLIVRGGAVFGGITVKN